MRSRKTNVALLLSAAALLAACGEDKAKTDNRVNLYKVSREDLPIDVKEGGELYAVNELQVKSQIEGSATILSLAPEGTLVKKGDKLVELDVTDLIDKRATQEISVEKARNELEQAKTAQDILEKELQATLNTAESQRQIARMELQKLLGARDGKGSEGKNRDMVRRLEELVNPAPPRAAAEASAPAQPDSGTGRPMIATVHPQNYAGLIGKVTDLLSVEGEEGNPLDRDMGEMANKILQQADTIRLAMADLKVKEDTAAHSRRLAEKQFITRNELERDELALQSQASKVTIAWNDLELLINYTLQKDKIELRQNVENAELEVARVTAKNDAERKNSQFDVDAKQKEFEIASERLATLNRQIDNSIIYSPGEGLVVYAKVSQGRGDSAPVEEGTSVRQYQTIIILPDNSKLQCQIKVQEAMIDKVRVGMPAHINAEVRPNDAYTGRVTYVAPVADSASRWSGNDKKVYTTKVLLDGLNRDESLKAGMKAAATITVDTVPGVLTVPIQAVRRDRSVNYLWKSTPQGPVAVAIKVGANNQEKVEVVEGISEGDEIYRTPPGGQADPKFPQPAAPEPAPAPAVPEGAGQGDGAPVAGDRGEGEQRPGGQRGGRGGFTRKKYTEMSPEELTEAKASLAQMGERFGAMLEPDKLTELNALIAQINQAIDANELEKAQTLRDGFRKLMPSGRGRGAPGGGDSGERGGRPRNGG